MTSSREVYNCKIGISELVRNMMTTADFSEASLIAAIIDGLFRGLSSDEFRHLQYAIQRKDAPADPIEEEWVTARIEAEEKARATARYRPQFSQ
jgi:hypothetical protein